VNELRISDCGLRIAKVSFQRRATFHFKSAIHNPQSAIAE